MFATVADLWSMRHIQESIREFDAESRRFAIQTPLRASFTLVTGEISAFGTGLTESLRTRLTVTGMFICPRAFGTHHGAPSELVSFCTRLALAVAARSAGSCSVGSITGMTRRAQKERAILAGSAFGAAGGAVVTGQKAGLAKAIGAEKVLWRA